MVSKKIQEAVSKQINAEFQSAYLYLAFSAHLDAQNLKGFSHWMRLQWQEEIEHGLKFHDHILRRGGTVELDAIEKPEYNAENATEIFEMVLEHERYITRCINELYETAKEEQDNPLQNLLQWFIDEQVEEEENAEEILEKLKLIGDHGPNLFLLDQELGQRAPESE